MIKYQLKQLIKVISEEIKDLKAKTKTKSNDDEKRWEHQSNLKQAQNYVRGLYLAYAYVRGKRLSSVEQRSLHPHNNFTDFIVVLSAKSELGMTEAKQYYYDIVHKPLPDIEFDSWVTGKVGAEFGPYISANEHRFRWIWGRPPKKKVNNNS